MKNHPFFKLGVAIMGCVLVFAGTAQGLEQMLCDSGLEESASDGSFPSSGCWLDGTAPGGASGLVTITAARSGNAGLWAYSGTESYSWYARIFQEFPAASGEVYGGSAWIRTPPGAEWVDGSKACTRIEFRNSRDVVLAWKNSPCLAGPNTDWTLSEVSSDPAPPGTAFVRFVFNVEKPSGVTGVSVANFDDSFFEKKPPPGDSFSVSPAALGFGSDLETLTFKIINNSGGTLSWNIKVDSDWLHVSPAGGTITSATETVTVTVERTGLDNSHYSGVIKITADEETRDVDVYMETVPAENVPAMPSVVTTDGRLLLVQRRLAGGNLGPARPYTIKGVVWSPAEIGTTSEYYQRRRAFENWYRLDLQLIRRMNANTVYVFLDFGTDKTTIETALDILDYCYRNGIMVVMTVDEDGSDNTANISQVVNAFMKHPAILMWALGNEWNLWRPDRPKYYHHYEKLADAAQAMEVNAQLVKSLDRAHPVASILGEINYPAQSEIENIINIICPAVDVWGANIYRGPEFYRLFEEWKAMSVKPLFLSEYGTDAFFTTSWRPPVGHEDPDMQADRLSSLWQDMVEELSAFNGANVCLGGTVFEWNDEWWKSNTGSTDAHDPDGYETTWNPIAHPDGFANEEWFGIVGIDRNKRQAFMTMQEGFSKVTFPGDFLLDSDVDGHDVYLFSTDYGRLDCSLDCEGDFNGDGIQDHIDLERFAVEFGRADS